MSGPGWDRARWSLEHPETAWIRITAADLTPAEVSGAVAFHLGTRLVVGALWSVMRVLDAEQTLLTMTAEVALPESSELEVVELRPGDPVWILADVDDALDTLLADDELDGPQ